MLFINLVLQVIFGFVMENELGFKNTALLYLIAGLGGTLASIVSTDDYAAGPNASVYGLIGGTFSWFVFDW